MDTVISHNGSMPFRTTGDVRGVVVLMHGQTMRQHTIYHHMHHTLLVWVNDHLLTKHGLGLAASGWNSVAIQSAKLLEIAAALY
jgi:hypothetical protein